MGPTKVSVEIPPNRLGPPFLEADKEAIFICASGKSYPPAKIEWTLPRSDRVGAKVNQAGGSQIVGL